MIVKLRCEYVDMHIIIKCYSKVLNSMTILSSRLYFRIVM